MCVLRELYGSGVEKLRIEHQSFTVSIFCPNTKSVSVELLPKKLKWGICPSHHFVITYGEDLLHLWIFLSFVYVTSYFFLCVLPFFMWPYIMHMCMLSCNKCMATEIFTFGAKIIWRAEVQSFSLHLWWLKWWLQPWVTCCTAVKNRPDSPPPFNVLSSASSVQRLVQKVFAATGCSFHDQKFETTWNQINLTIIWVMVWVWGNVWKRLPHFWPKRREMHKKGREKTLGRF